MNEFYVYLIKNNQYTYIGFTNDIEKRIKRHNGILSGGAKYTKSKGFGWKYVCYISGFNNKIDALRFEWAFKHVKIKKRISPIEKRIEALKILLNKDYWTSKSPIASDTVLILKWINETYKPKKIELPYYIFTE